MESDGAMKFLLDESPPHPDGYQNLRSSNQRSEVLENNKRKLVPISGLKCLSPSSASKT